MTSSSPASASTNSGEPGRLRPCRQVLHVPGELALRLSLLLHPISACSKFLHLGRSSPPRHVLAGAIPVTIRWGRRLQIVQRVVLRLARPFVRVLPAGIAVAGNNCLAGSVLLCPSTDGLGPRPRGN
jgi:hypothetical protein